MPRMLVRVGRKGVVVIPKAFREAVNIGEGDELVAEVVGDAIVLRPLRPKVVDIDVGEADRVISEERREWERRLGETGS